MTFTTDSKLSDLFSKAVKENGTVIDPNNYDETIKKMQSELDCVLKLAFDAWYELRVVPIDALRGIPRVRYIASKGDTDGKQTQDSH